MIPGGLSEEQVEVYANATGKIAAAVESLTRQDGWKIFLALYERKKREIREKDDYASLEDFKADRRAIEIVDGIIEVFKGYIQDAQDAADTLKALSEEPPQDRGIMLIEQAESGTMEG